MGESDLPAPPAGESIVLGSIQATPAGVYYTLALVSQGGANQAVVGGSLWRVPLVGGLPRLVADGALFGQPGVTRQGVLVREDPFGMDPARIAIFPLSGGAPRTIVTLPSGDIVLADATDGSTVFFTDQNGLEAVPLDPASRKAAVTLAFAMNAPSVVGAVAQRLILVHPQGAVECVDLPLRPDSKPFARGTCAAGSSRFHAWGRRGYWLAGVNTLETMDALVGPPTALATMTGPLAQIGDFDFDGANFYLLGQDEQGTALTLARMPAGGGAHVSLLTMPHAHGYSVSVDDQCVYWTVDDSIYSLAKSAPPQSDSSADAGDTGDAAVACAVPSGVWTTATCTPIPTGNICVGGGGCKPLCDSAHYELQCTGSDPAPSDSVGCSAIPIPTPSNRSWFCCPCADADASQ